MPTLGTFNLRDPQLFDRGVLSRLAHGMNNSDINVFLLSLTGTKVKEMFMGKGEQKRK